MKPNVLVLRAPGTNCDLETSYAFELAGATTERVHVNRILENPSIIERFQIMCFPGGFSYGDDIAAGRVLATKVRASLFDAIHNFRDAGKLILGVCNGFQILIKSGILVADDEQGAPVTLTWNKSGVYTDRWTRLEVKSDKCVFLKGVENMYLPIAHAEGKFMARDETVLDKLEAEGRLVLRYVPSDNPNGAMRDVAGVCDETGRVFGLMPHPERHVDKTQRPNWTRFQNEPDFATRVGDGLQIFKNAVEYFN